MRREPVPREMRNRLSYRTALRRHGRVIPGSYQPTVAMKLTPVMRLPLIVTVRVPGVKRRPG